MNEAELTLRYGVHYADLLASERREMVERVLRLQAFDNYDRLVARVHALGLTLSRLDRDAAELIDEMGQGKPGHSRV